MSGPIITELAKPVRKDLSSGGSLGFQSAQPGEVVNVSDLATHSLLQLNWGLTVGGFTEAARRFRGQYQQVAGVDDATFFPERKSCRAQDLA